MPNWCNNIIRISGEESNMKPIHDFFQKASTANSDEEFWVMSTLVPENEEFEEIKASGQYLLSPYVEYYGTKWDFQANECSGESIEPTAISFSVATAWSPPEAFCQRLSELYKVNVSVEFEESGNDFAGRSSYGDGEEIESVTYPYREGMYYLDNETFWYDVESDLEWMFCENPNITIDEVLGQMYPFITDEEDIKTITEIYNEQKVDESTEE